MLSSLKLQLKSPLLGNNNSDAGNFVFSGRSLSVRLPPRQFASISVQSENSSSISEPLVTSRLNSTVGCSSSSALQWNITHRHIHILNFIACATAVSATWLFLSAIPTLLAIRRAAESLAKLMDVTREELPDTMAAVRLSGMEISDLTMELSDIGQELTRGVRSSTQAVRVAEERLRQFSSMTRSATMQEDLLVQTETRTLEVPALAKKVRDLKEGIVKGRAVLQILFALPQYYRIIFNFFKSRAKA